jgi:hypothetical protein
MAENHTRGEMHGCIVCGKLYQMYVVTDPAGRFIGCTVMTPGGRVVPDPARPLVGCEKHSEEEVQAAVDRVYGPQANKED